jgi:hypothetical protein
MRQLLLIIISATVFATCQEPSKTKEKLSKDYLSEWFEQNEDSLHKEFLTYVIANSLCSTCDTTWGEMAYQKIDSTSYMGRFSLEAQKYCNSIRVTYFYNKYTFPTTRIQLSPNYNKKCIVAFDSIFRHIDTPKYFKIEKYKQAEERANVLSFQNGNIVVKDIRINTSSSGHIFDLTIYLKAASDELIVEAQERLQKILFGEELFLKKIGKVGLVPYQELPDTLMTVQQIREILR